MRDQVTSESSSATVDLRALLADREEELRFQRAVAACARALLSGDASERIGDALDALLAASEATTLFVAINVDDPELGYCSHLIHEATKGGFVVDNERWRLVPWARLPDSGAVLARGEPFLFRAGDFGPVEAQTRAETTVKAGAQHPIYRDGRWAGIVGFVDHEVERVWSDDDLRLLSAGADMFARLWERQARERALEDAVAGSQKRYRYERAIAVCSQALLAGTDEHALQVALDALVGVTAATFGTIERNVDDPDLGLCSQLLYFTEIPRDGSPPTHVHDDYWSVMPWSRMPDSYARLSAGKPFAFLVSDLGPVERATYETSPRRLVAEVDIPIMVDGDWRGLIVFGYPDDHHDFEHEDIALFQTAADMVAAYWLRQDARIRLEELVRSKDEFLAAVSHELRTPLTTVVGLAEELRDRGDDFTPDDRQEFSALIAEQGLEMAHLVDDLLVAARGDFGAIDFDLVPVDIAGECARIVASLQDRSEIGVSAGSECAVVADPVRVRQILRNLITNAIRYGGPVVRVDCAVESGTVVVAVSDDGPAIESSVRERIFEPYQRAHEEPTQPASVGLGLTVSRRLARLMGGDLVYRRSGDRNVFELALPAASGP